ncbi:MAG: hypothetical protein QHI48_06060 [Bacteroidota bacterium]|nr:hypothetical protein [Bacteroidota bacterium]
MNKHIHAAHMSLCAVCEKAEPYRWPNMFWKMIFTLLHVFTMPAKPESEGGIYLLCSKTGKIFTYFVVTGITRCLLEKGMPDLIPIGYRIVVSDECRRCGNKQLGDLQFRPQKKLPNAGKTDHMD